MGIRGTDAVRGINQRNLVFALALALASAASIGCGPGKTSATAQEALPHSDARS